MDGFQGLPPLVEVQEAKPPGGARGAAPRVLPLKHDARPPETSPLRSAKISGYLLSRRPPRPAYQPERLPPDRESEQV